MVTMTRMCFNLEKAELSSVLFRMFMLWNFALFVVPSLMSLSRFLDEAYEVIHWDWISFHWSWLGEETSSMLPWGKCLSKYLLWQWLHSSTMKQRHAWCKSSLSGRRSSLAAESKIMSSGIWHIKVHKMLLCKWLIVGSTLSLRLY